MIVCWIHHTKGYSLINDSGNIVGVIIPVTNQTHDKHSKRLYEPTRWFKMDGHKSIGKPPDRRGEKSA